MASKKEILTLKEVAELTRYNLKYLNNHYMRIFAGQGVQVLRIAPNAEPRFYKSEILGLMESAK